MLRRQKIQQPSAVSGAEVTLPPLETLSVQLSALSLVTRGMNARGVDLAPMLDRDRKTRLIDVSGVTAAVSVLDTLKVLPVLEVAVEWHLLFRFYDTVDKTILLHPTNGGTATETPVGGVHHSIVCRRSQGIEDTQHTVHRLGSSTDGFGARTDGSHRKTFAT